MEAPGLLSVTRHIDQARVDAYARAARDPNPIHVDEEFARTSPFKTRVPHGPLIHDMYLGLMDRLGLVAGTAMAFLELRWKFLAPVLMGDTVHERVTVRDKRETKKPDRGIVTFAVTLFNQRGEPVQESEHVLMLARNARD